ncbi:hypothetical protein QL285_093738 [Trifolium repens]|nr:hypothetical protein QL285_093738 [Trifolium repens]
MHHRIVTTRVIILASPLPCLVSHALSRESEAASERWRRETDGGAVDMQWWSDGGPVVMRRRRRQPESAITRIGGGGFVRWKTSSSISPILFRFSSLWPFVLWFCFYVFCFFDFVLGYGGW